MQSVELQILLRAMNAQSVDDLIRKLGELKTQASAASPPVENLNKSMGGFGGGTNSATAALGRFMPSVSLALPIIATLAATVGGATKASLDFVEAQAKNAKEVQVLADRLGLSIGQANKLKLQAEQTGTSFESFGAGVRRLSVALSDSEGEGKKVATMLRALGVETKDATGRQKEAGQVLLDTLSVLSRVGNESQRTALAQRVFGEEGATQVRGLLKNYQELEASTKNVGKNVNEAAYRELDKAGKALKEFNYELQQLKISAAGKIAPIVIPIITTLKDIIQGAEPTANDPRSRIGGQPNINFFRSLGIDSRSAIDNLNAKGIVNGDRIEAELMASAQDEARRKKQQQDNERAKRLLEQRNNQFDGLIDSLDQRALSPLARLLFDTQDRLEEVVKKFGPLTGTDRQFFTTFDETGRSAVGSIPGNGESGQAGDAFRKAFLRLAYSDKLETSSAPSNPQSISDYLLGNLLPQNRTSVRGMGFLRGQADTAAAEFRARVEYQERMIELLAGPGGEIEAARKIRDLRIETAKDQVAAQQAVLDYQIRIAEVAAKQRQDWRNTTGQVFDAVTRGGGGISNFIQGYGTSIGRTLFQNGGDLLFNSVRGRLELPGQVTTDQATGAKSLNAFGKLLQGTPLGVDPLKFATDANTAATIANTDALRQLGAGGGGTGGAGGAGGTLAALSGTASRLVSGDAAGAIASLSKFSSGGKAQMQPIYNELGEIDGYMPTPPSSLAKTVGAAGALAAGTFGVISGIRQGGVRGAFTATGSAAGTAAALLPLLGATGPAAPILGAVALGLGLGSTLFGDPKKKRDTQIGNEINSRQFSDFTGTSYNTDVYGRGYDYNSRGDLRPIVVNVNALDLKSIVDRRDDLTEAVRMATSEGHPIVKEIQSLVVPAL